MSSKTYIIVFSLLIALLPLQHAGASTDFQKPFKVTQLFQTLNDVLSGEVFEKAAEEAKQSMDAGPNIPDASSAESKSSDNNANTTGLPSSLPRSGEKTVEQIEADIDSQKKKKHILKARRGKQGIPLPIKNPHDHSYRNARLPQKLYKKSYNKENAHLPPLVYTKEYKNILYNAITTGQIEIIRTLIRRLESTEVKDDEGNTPLIYAVLAGNPASALVLLGMDASPNALNKYHLSPLYIATAKKDYKFIKILLEWGADPNLGDTNGTTPLMKTVIGGDQIATKLMILAGADVNARRNDGNTALHLATKYNNKQAVQLLLQAGASVNTVNSQGMPPLAAAISNDNSEIISMLLDEGASLTGYKKNLANLTNNKEMLEIIESENIIRELEAAKNGKVIKVNTKSKSQAPISTGETPTPVQKPWFKGTDKKVPTPYFPNKAKAGSK